MNQEKLNRIAVLTQEIDMLNEQMQPLRIARDTKNTERSALHKEVENEILSAHQDVVDRFNDEGAEYVFVDMDNADDLTYVCEDDGTLHISFGKIRGCFICDQDMKKGDWNRRAKFVMKTFNIPAELQKNGLI